jgi:hypothetical protein
MLAVVAALALASCGPEEPPPPPPTSPSPSDSPPPSRPASPAQLLAQAAANTWAAPSKRVQGSVTLAGAGQAKTFDYVLVGSLAKGTQTETAPGLTSVVQVIKIGDDIYILADEPFWQWYVPLEQLRNVVGKWVKARYDDYPSTVPVSSYSTPAAVGDVTVDGTDTVGGTPVSVLLDARRNRYFVSQDGEPFLLRFEGTQATEVGEATIAIEFSQLGAVADVIVAPTAEIVDLYALPTIAVGHD